MSDIKKETKYCYIIPIIVLTLLVCFINYRFEQHLSNSDNYKETIDNLAAATQTTVVTTSAPVETIEVETIEPETIEAEEPEEATFYETLSPQEISYLEVTVQHEVGSFSDKYKRYVAELIYNRILSPSFPNTVEGVLFQENQFCGIENWYYPEFPVDDSTKEVVRDVFSRNDTSHDATFYYNRALTDYENTSWFENSETIEFAFGYTEKNWGTEYTTRFFKLKEE